MVLANDLQRDATITVRNGLHTVSINLLQRRDRGTVTSVIELFTAVADELRGSYGLIYCLDDERTEAAWTNRWVVWTIARGTVAQAEDPFLSPVDPVIETNVEAEGHLRIERPGQG